MTIKILQFYFVIFIVLIAAGCSDSSDHYTFFPKENLQGEYIYRKDAENFMNISLPRNKPSPTYSWEEHHSYTLPSITKEYFRCKGSGLNPEKIVKENEEIQKYCDCEGREKHGLPLRNGQEFIYPILIDLLNYIQDNLKQRVIITSGHRCPEHNDYVDSSKMNRYSKHMIGAEVSFYVKGYEYVPMKIIELVKEYYLSREEYKNSPEYNTFHRYENNDTNVSIKPWMNKEIFLKLFDKSEGRDFDNRHPYPYISIQVRYDKELGERVIYTWNKAYRQYLRR